MRPVSLMGGTLKDDGTLRGGFNEIYGRSSFDFGQSITTQDGVVPTPPLVPGEVSPYGEKFVPMAGITEIATETQGELGALRKATISWQCWSLEQLEFYEKFLKKPVIFVGKVNYFLYIYI